MKHLIIFILISYASVSSAQVQFELNAGHPTPLEANAGQDTVIGENDNIMIGGKPAASHGYGNYSYFWEPDEGLNNPNFANPLANPDETTTYTLTVTDGNNCSAISSVTVTIDEELKMENEFTPDMILLYPNPNPGTFTISFSPDIHEETDIVIYNVNGQIVYRGHAHPQHDPEKEIRLDGDYNGPFYVKIQNENGVIIKPVIITTQNE